MKLRRAMVCVVALVLLPTACGRDDERSGTCGPMAVEQVDSRLFHLLPASPPPSFLTDPPTSGPHVSGLRVSGVQTRTLTGVEQVSTLELGVVIVQYGTRTTAEDRASLEALAGDTVTVAPSGRGDDQVIVTGWITKMTCAGVDVDAISTFVEKYAATSTAPGIGN